MSKSISLLVLDRNFTDGLSKSAFDGQKWTHLDLKSNG